jgi:hypothetical protein
MSPEQLEEIYSLVRNGLIQRSPEELADMLMVGIREMSEPELQELVDQMSQDEVEGTVDHIMGGDGEQL